MKIDLYTQSGEKKGTVNVSDAMFKAPMHEETVRLAVLRQTANARQANAHTKTRGEVRGGGHKPWKQKGTGRARFGSSRNPIWRGGGVAFGPTNERNYTKGINKKAWRAALFSCLSKKAEENMVFALDEFKVKVPKTKEFTTLISKLPVKRSLLVVLPIKDEAFQKTTRNIPNVKTILVNYLNPYDVLLYENIMFLESSIKKAEELFLK